MTVCWASLRTSACRAMEGGTDQGEHVSPEFVVKAKLGLLANHRPGGHPREPDRLPACQEDFEGHL